MRRLFLIWNKRTQKYYRLWDVQEKRYLASCYNSYGLKDLLDRFLTYIEPQLDPSDPDDIYSWESFKECPEHNIVGRMEAWGYVVESSKKAFKPICKHEKFIRI